MAYSPDEVTAYHRWKSLLDHRGSEDCPYCGFEDELNEYRLRVEAINTHATFSYRGCPSCGKAFR